MSLLDNRGNEKHCTMRWAVLHTRRQYPSSGYNYRVSSFSTDKESISYFVNWASLAVARVLVLLRVCTP